MKRNILLILISTMAALAVNVNAQDISIEDVSAGVAKIKTDSSAGIAPTPVAVTPEAIAAPEEQTAPFAELGGHKDQPSPFAELGGNKHQPSPFAELGGHKDQPSPFAEREWLVLVFVNGRNNLARASITDVNEMEMVGSTDKVAVTVELGLLNDRGNSSRFYIQKDTTPTPANEINSITSPAIIVPGSIISPAIIVPGSDMGSWKHFVDFAKWSYRKYPAKKVLAVLWGHGSGRVDIGGADNLGAELGIASDDLTKNFIRNKQIAMALREIERAIGKKVSIYASDSCTMQMASVVYEIGASVELIVGAEESTPNDGLPYDSILAHLTADPGMDPAALSSVIVNDFFTYYKATSYDTTLSTIKPSELPGFVRLLNDWVRAAAVPANRKKVLEAEQEALAFEDGYNGNDTVATARSKDLYDFVDLVGRKAGNTSRVFAKGELLKDFISTRLVISNKTTQVGGKYDRAKGIAAYFPKLIYDSSYDETLFSRDSLWDDFLKWKLDPTYKPK